jgi:conjugative transfer signal peptidase TraF
MRFSYLILFFILIAVAVSIVITGATINVTPSMKIGLYIKQEGEIKRGDIVLVCLTEPYKTIGLHNQYIMQGSRCNGANSLIKEVVALPNDLVILTDSSLEINGKTYPYRTYYFDSKDRPLSVYPRGKYRKGYWLIGTNNDHSWDSRYFGPINKNQILCKLKAILVW